MISVLCTVVSAFIKRCIGADIRRSYDKYICILDCLHLIELWCFSASWWWQYFQRHEMTVITQSRSCAAWSVQFRLRWSWQRQSVIKRNCVRSPRRLLFKSTASSEASCGAWRFLRYVCLQPMHFLCIFGILIAVTVHNLLVSCEWLQQFAETNFWCSSRKIGALGRGCKKCFSVLFYM